MRLPRLQTFALWVVAIATAVPALAADTAAESPRLKYLPNDYWLVAECDVGTIMKFMSSEGAKNNPQYAQFQQYLQLAKQFTGIDLETDVTWATVFATGKLEKPKGLVVVQGTFNNAAVIKRLTKSLQGNIVEDEYKKHTLYTIDSATFCFPEASTILLGDEDTVKEALDQLAEGKRKLPESLKAVLGRTKTNSLVWAAVRPQFFLEDKDNLPEWLTADAELLKALNKIECVSVTAEVSQDGLTFKGLGYVPKGEAKSVYQYLSDRKKNLLHHEGTNVLFTTLLILAEVKMDDTFIQGSFRLTTESLKELWNTKLIVRPESSGSGKEPQGRDK